MVININDINDNVRRSVYANMAPSLTKDTMLKNAYDGVIVIEVKDGNPNGDPDADNMPRIDFETRHGLISDCCIKRKMRNITQHITNDPDHYSIFVVGGNGISLNSKIVEAYERVNGADVDPSKLKPETKFKYERLTQVDLCYHFYDIRAFGGVLSTSDKDENEDKTKKSKNKNAKGKGKNAKNETTENAENTEDSENNNEDKPNNKKTAGKVTGPVQISMFRSVEPIRPQMITITREAITSDKEAWKVGTIGHKYIVPYGLYVGYINIMPTVAAQTGFDKADFEVLLKSIEHMFDIDHAAGRGTMSLRKVILFEHESMTGDVPSFKLHDRVKIKRISEHVARSFDDYEVTLDGKPIDRDKVVEIVKAKM